MCDSIIGIPISSSFLHVLSPSSIQSGFYFGYLYAINGILNKIIKESKFKPKIFITGGLGKIFKDKINYNPIYNENLTLEGLKQIGNKIYGK